MAKAKKKTIKEAAKHKDRTIMMILLAFLGVVLCAWVIYIAVVFSYRPRGIDCMPPMSAEEQQCLDDKKCYCETY